jgi:hypothetical protein
MRALFGVSMLVFGQSCPADPFGVALAKIKRAHRCGDPSVRLRSA